MACKAWPIAIQTSTDQCSKSPWCQRAQFEVAVQMRATKDMSGKPRLNANPESTINGGVATMSLPFKKKKARTSAFLHRMAVPSRYAHCRSDDARGSIVAASHVPQLDQVRQCWFHADVTKTSTTTSKTTVWTPCVLSAFDLSSPTSALLRPDFLDTTVAFLAFFLVSKTAHVALSPRMNLQSK